MGMRGGKSAGLENALKIFSWSIEATKERSTWRASCRYMGGASRDYAHLHRWYGTFSRRGQSCVVQLLSRGRVSNLQGAFYKFCIARVSICPGRHGERVLGERHVCCIY